MTYKLLSEVDISYRTDKAKQSDPLLLFLSKKLPSTPFEGEELQLHAGTNHNDTSCREKQNGAVEHQAKLYIDIDMITLKTTITHHCITAGNKKKLHIIAYFI